MEIDEKKLIDKLWRMDVEKAKEETHVAHAFNRIEKSEKISNFSLGFSIFTLFFVLFVELVIKK